MKYKLFLLSLLMCVPAIALAYEVPASSQPPVTPTLSAANPTGGPTTLMDWYYILQNVVGWLFVIAVIVGVLMLIVAGIMYITSSSSGKNQTATNIIIYAVVGIAVAALAWAIVNLVGNYFVGQPLIGPH